MENRRLVIGGVLGVLLLAIGFGAGFYYGVGPAPGGPDSGGELTDFPTATATETTPFLISIEKIEECGQTCRDVTATIQNNQAKTATGVTVFTRVFAGKDNSAEGDLVWEGKEEVGTIDAGSSHTTTRRVELSLLEAYQIQQHDGWITIVTTVQSDQRTVTFRDSEQVA